MARSGAAPARRRRHAPRRGVLLRVKRKLLLVVTDGANPGVASGTTAAATPTSCAETVLFGGMPVMRLCGTTSHNAGNASGAYVVPSQTVVLVLAP